MRYLLCLALVCVAAPAQAGRYLSAIAIAIATDNGAPTPAPVPAPSGECDNCNGTGKLGDGTVFVPCPVCGGDGIKGNAPAQPAQPAALHPQTATPSAKPQSGAAGGAVVKSTPARRGYPVRGGWWTGCPNWTHLTRGEHTGQFDHAWLRTLSNAELQSLHSDAHEGRVKWAYVVRPASSGATRQTTAPTSYCPSGRCPSSSYSAPSRSGFRFLRR